MVTYFEAVKSRRSIHSLENIAVVPDEQVIEIVHQALTHVPTAFNAQETRALILFDEAHTNVWNNIEEITKASYGDRDFTANAERFAGFRNGHGTVLFFQETAITNGLIEKMPQFSGEFPVWAQQNQGMLQFAIWTGLEAVGYGASLQHYNSATIQPEWEVPATWSLIAQMPFGKQGGPLKVKQYGATEQRYKIIR